MKLIPLSYEILRFPEKEDALLFLERVCRVAYASEGKIKPGSAEKLLRKVYKVDRRARLTKVVVGVLDQLVRESQGAPFPSLTLVAENIVNQVFDKIRDDPPHNSIGDHLHATVLFHVGRGFTHEAVRHRVGVGYLQRSTRYVGAGRGAQKRRLFEVVARAPRDFASADEGFQKWLTAIEDAERNFGMLSEKEQNQVARGVLPIDIYAPLVVTGSFTYWRHFFRMRTPDHVHPDMKTLIRPLMVDFQSRMPIVFEELI